MAFQINAASRPKATWYKDAAGNPLTIGDGYDSAYPVAVRFE